MPLEFPIKGWIFLGGCCRMNMKNPVILKTKNQELYYCWSATWHFSALVALKPMDLYLVMERLVKNLKEEKVGNVL